MAFAAGGLGFALGNLLLARLLPVEEYGALSLFLALTQIGITIGPFGFVTTVNRHNLTAGPWLLNRVGVASVVAGLGLAALAYTFYGFTPVLGLVLAITVAAAGLNRVGSAFFQSRQQFGMSLFLIVVNNWVVLCAVPVVLLVREPSALPAALVTTTGYLIMALVGWQRAWAHGTSSAPAVPMRVLLHEGVAALGTQLASSLLFQLERLIIPRTLSIAELATFSVVSALASSPYRMLQVGVGYALLPKLRASSSRKQALKLITREGVLTFGILAVASVGVLLFTPWIVRLFLGDRYTFATSLLVAIVVIGLVRVWSAFATVVVTALGSARQLMIMNVLSWAAVALAAVCAIWASRYGLTGVVVGTGAGWLATALAGSVIALRAWAKWSRPQTPEH